MATWQCVGCGKIWQAEEPPTECACGCRIVREVAVTSMGCAVSDTGHQDVAPESDVPDVADVTSDGDAVKTPHRMMVVGVIAALFCAVVGAGVWWHDHVQRNNSSHENAKASVIAPEKDAKGGEASEKIVEPDSSRSSEARAELEQEVYLLQARAERKFRGLESSGLDRGQGFGARLDGAAEYRVAGDRAVKDGKFPAAKKCFENAIAGAAWVETNAPLRQTALALRDGAEGARKAADAMDGEKLAKVDYDVARRLAADAAAAFESGAFSAAGELSGKSRESFAAALSRARAGKVGMELESARAAKTRQVWPDVLRYAAAALVLDGECSEAQALIEECWIRGGTVDLGGGVLLELVWCPAGSFMMGSPESETDRSDGEMQHRVTLTKGFWIGKTEVTQRQWAVVMGSNPSKFVGDDLPVEQVSWEDCQVFINKLNAKAGGGSYRLPTEAEWEYACRAGTQTAFHYGDRLDSIMANFDGNYPYGGAAKGVYRERTTAAGLFQPNAWGLYDMHGNVWEWCADWYGGYSDGSVTDPGGAASGALRVLRGGCWRSRARDCRSANRDYYVPSIRYYFLGFRLAMTLP